LDIGCWLIWIPDYDLRGKVWLGLLVLSPCCAAAYDMHTEMSSSPTGGLCLPAGKHMGILIYFQTMSTKKTNKKALFLDAENAT